MNERKLVNPNYNVDIEDATDTGSLWSLDISIIPPSLASSPWQLYC